MGRSNLFHSSNEPSYIKNMGRLFACYTKAMDALPPLPRRLRKKEASLTPRVFSWAKKAINGPVALEIKQTDTDSIPASALLPHQRLALLAACSKEGLAHKLTDEARRRQPFDAFILKNTPAYVVACFTKHKIAHVFHVKSWEGARYNDTTSAYTFRV